jgi:hypothetical protein
MPTPLNPLATPVRTLTPEEKAIVEELYRRKINMGSSKPAHAYVTLTREITKNDDSLSLGKQVGKKQVFAAGTTLKIVMVSRFGDCGVTDNLNADSGGYFTRFQFDDPSIVDIRWQPTPTKEWNEFLSGIIAQTAPYA